MDNNDTILMLGQVKEAIDSFRHETKSNFDDVKSAVRIHDVQISKNVINITELQVKLNGVFKAAGGIGAIVSLIISIILTGTMNCIIK